ALSRNFWATHRSRPRRSIPRSTRSGCSRPIAAPTRARDAFLTAFPATAPPLARDSAWPHRRSVQPPEEGMMAGAHEQMERSEHAEHAAHSNKGIALLISVLALFLAFSETLGKSAQTSALNFQIESSDLWNFFQAKNIRRTLTIVATEA